MKQAILDYGLISSIGNGKVETATKLFSEERTGLSPIEIINGKQSFAGKIEASLNEIPKRLSKLNSRNNQLLLSVFNQIKQTFDKVKSDYKPEQIGIVLGTSTSGISDVEKAFEFKGNNSEFPNDFHYKKHEMGSPSEFLAELIQCEGPAYTVSCACSSGSKAMASASRLLSTGICDLVIAGGVDTLCNLTLLGFDSLEVISENMCLPFSKNRNGINIGEAGALFLMSNKPGELNLCGYGESSDAHHQSAPDPEGRGATKAMSSALELGKLRPHEISYINLHGTSTIQNDSMEAKAVNTTFGSETLCSSTKPLTGHTLGAAGAIEAAFSLLCIEHQKLPIHHWDKQADSALPAINLVKSASPDGAIINRIMSNSYAFGGNNCSLILGDNS